MIGAIGPQSITPSPETGPGKRAMAIGQQAKLAVAEAKAAGADLPRNAQGMAASAIAKGADAASIFAGLTAPDVPVGDGETGETDPGAPPAPTGDVVTTPDIVSDQPPTSEASAPAAGTGLADQTQISADAPTGPVVDAASIALDLLDGATEPAI